MKEMGYSESYANSGHIKSTKSWKGLMEEFLPQDLLAKKHNELLNASSVDHMVFPVNVEDKDIIELLYEVGCIVKRLMHSETQTHVWFFAPDNNARKSALDMAYKLNKSYGDTTIIHKFGELSDTELEEEIAGEISEAVGLVEGEEAPSGK